MISVPLSFESVDPANGTVSEQLDSKVQLKCHVIAFPKPKIIWQRTDLNTLTVSDVEVDGRIFIETKFYPEPTSPSDNSNSLESSDSTIQVTTVESVLIFKSLMRADNGSYTCKALSTYSFEKPLLSHFNVIVLEIPEIHIEKLEIENKTSTIVTFIVDYNGNLPIDKYTLEIVNFTVANSTWMPVNVPTSIITSNHSYSSIRIDNLMPGASYGFRLAANNKVDQSEWSYMNISVPPDVPSTIINVHLLSKTNETLLFGWRRPLYDNGSPIKLYQMLLRDDNDTLVSNQTLDITNSGAIQSRNNYMYMFPSLRPGSHYKYQVRACSHVGCSVWSSVLDAATSDGHADPPLNIKIECSFDEKNLQNIAVITWDPPVNPRGSIEGYNISLEGHANYRNGNNRFVLEQFQQYYEVMDTETFKHQVFLKPNSNYTVRLCAINKSGCGQLSHITSSSMCHSAPITPSEFPLSIQFEQTSLAFVNKDNNQVNISPFGSSRRLKLHVPRISERNGSIKCYRIIIMRLPTLPPNTNSSAESSDRIRLYDPYIPDRPEKVVLRAYEEVREMDKDTLAAYVATEFTSDNLQNNIIIGDGKNERCYDDNYDYDLRSKFKFNGAMEDNRSPRRINYDMHYEYKINNSNSSQTSKKWVQNGELLSNTNYSGFIEVSVITWNGTVLYARSPFIEPIETEPIQYLLPELSKSAFSETTTGILFGTICGLVLVLVLFISVLCFLKRKATENTSNMIEDERIGLTSLIRRTIGGNRKNSLFCNINFNSLNSIKKWVSKPIPIHNLMAVFQEKHANSDFIFQAGKYV